MGNIQTKYHDNSPENQCIFYFDYIFYTPSLSHLSKNQSPPFNPLILCQYNSLKRIFAQR